MFLIGEGAVSFWADRTSIFRARLFNNEFLAHLAKAQRVESSLEPLLLCSVNYGLHSVTGGFWALPVAVQTPGAPTLTIVAAAAGFAQISWSPATPGFVLQEAPTATGAWTNSPSGAANPVNLPAIQSAMFYRLFKP